MERFARCVGVLHANILEGFEDWCEHVGLPSRLPAVQHAALSRKTHSPVSC